MFALVLTGPPGAGKSTVLEALADALYDHDVRHACLESDAASWAHPTLTTEQILRHVEALCRLYRDEGHDLLLVTTPVLSPGEFDALLPALCSEHHFIVALDASEETLERRIADREPTGWSQLGALLQRSQLMKAAMASSNVADLVIDTDGLSRTAVVERIRAACPRLI